MTLLRFLILAAVKALSRLFFRFDSGWVAPHGEKARRPPEWDEVRVAILLNHTSLFEPIFLGLAPASFLWAVARHGLLPGADSTLDRPLVGRFFKTLAPDVVALTRTRDQTWRDFLSRLGPRTLVIMAPEGRMKRSSGLDKRGQPMTVRGGIADVLDGVVAGRMLIVYSGGLHHVHAPGDTFPRLFKTVRARLELVDIPSYKKELGCGRAGFAERVIADLEGRRARHCPTGFTTRD